jgi:hypothetical protein
MTIREWLDQPPPPEIIAKLKEGDREIEYIPIGQVEKMLDEKFLWDTADFKFQIYKTGTYWFASGSVELSLQAMGDDYFRPVKTGAATIVISHRDDNMHYESTILSLATSNAAAKLGRRFGRELNGRMEVGETSFVNNTAPDVIDRADQRLKILIDNAKNFNELEKFKADCKSPEMVAYYMQRAKELVKL